MTKDSGFDAAKHLTKVSGQEYLPVKWRLVWLRDVHPDAAIGTDMISMNEQHAIFKATVTLPSGGSATGWGSETPGDFRDYIEKAETKALGRALAALGFGTQFTGDDLSEGERIVDAPVQRQTHDAPQTVHNAPQRQEAPRPVSGPGEASPKQLGMIRGLAKQKGISPDRLEARCSQLYSTPLDRLSKRDASDLIERLQAVPDPESDVVADDDSDPVSRNADLIEGFSGGSTNPMFT